MKVTQLANLLMVALVCTLAAAGCKKKPTPLINIPKGQIGNPTAPTETGIGNGNPAGGGGGVKSDGVTSANTGGGAGTGTGGGAGAGSGPLSQPNPGDFSNYTADAEKFKSETVYFGYDSAVVKTLDKAAAVAEFCKANPADAIRIEGHCDERGTEEYNRALGDRRALALREALISLGVDASKVITLSFGKDRPASEGHDEEAWSKNRRGEFILLTPPK